MSVTDTIELRRVSVSYGDVQVLWDVDIGIARGDVVAILGSNGAGKSTVMNAISGVAPVIGGQVLFEGRDITAVPTKDRVPLGIAHVLERHRLFPFMTVLENLKLGAYIPSARGAMGETMEWTFELFPFLRDRQQQLAGGLSGGEQQMLAIARGLMSRPKVIMLDEPFLGLSPLMVQNIINVVALLKRRGLTVIFIEQHVRHSLAMADRAYILEAGRVVLTGTSAELAADDRIKRIYMGLEAELA
jgi:branched-chain amino acid transport system ATP-binding protein